MGVNRGAVFVNDDGVRGCFLYYFFILLVGWIVCIHFTIALLLNVISRELGVAACQAEAGCKRYEYDKQQFNFTAHKTPPLKKTCLCRQYNQW